MNQKHLWLQHHPTPSHQDEEGSAQVDEEVPHRLSQTLVAFFDLPQNFVAKNSTCWFIPRFQNHVWVIEPFRKESSKSSLRAWWSWEAMTIAKTKLANAMKAATPLRFDLGEQVNQLNCWVSLSSWKSQACRSARGYSIRGLLAA